MVGKQSQYRLPEYSRTPFKIASFSVDVQLYGYVTIHAAYDDAGFIQVESEIEALEYRDYSFEGLKIRGMVRSVETDITADIKEILSHIIWVFGHMYPIGVGGGGANFGPEAHGLHVSGAQRASSKLRLKAGRLCCRFRIYCRRPPFLEQNCLESCKWNPKSFNNISQLLFQCPTSQLGGRFARTPFWHRMHLSPALIPWAPTGANCVCRVAMVGPKDGPDGLEIDCQQWGKNSTLDAWLS
eukprot:1144052-Pelagomonas_calceolata.AAC.9